MVEQLEGTLQLNPRLGDNGAVHTEPHGQGAEGVRYDAEGNFCRRGREAYKVNGKNKKIVN